MKVYNRQDFLKLPEGIFFAKGGKWVIDGFCVKGETIERIDGKFSDFYYLNLVDICSHNSEQHFDRLEEMLEKGKSYPINEAYGRDGMFDDEDLFLVFEEDDLICIRNLISENKGKL